VESAAEYVQYMDEIIAGIFVFIVIAVLLFTAYYHRKKLAVLLVRLCKKTPPLNKKDTKQSHDNKTKNQDSFAEKKSQDLEKADFQRKKSLLEPDGSVVAMEKSQPRKNTMTPAVASALSKLSFKASNKKR